jgi:hypothetical protein
MEGAFMPPTFLPTLLRALTIGAFGGTALVLTQVYSRRGPLVYPVYAAILFALGLFLARVAGLGFGARLLICFVAISLSTAISLVATLFLAARARARLLAEGRKLVPGRAPIWAWSLIVVVLVAASAGVAYVSS